MLQEMQIHGLALIDELSINFCSGLNVITGETGAGKSILIKALQVLLGSKSTSNLIRSGCESATITAHFQMPEKNHLLHARLESLGIPYEEGLVFRKQIFTKGRTRQWVNDIAVTQATLRELTSELIDVFGQHDNLKLLNPQEHLNFVDLFFDNPQILSDYQQAYDQALALFNELDTLIAKHNRLSRDRDYLTFRLSELEQLNPSPEDYLNLQELAKISLTRERLKEHFNNAIQALTLEDGESLTIRLWQAQKALSYLAEHHDKFMVLKEQATSLAEAADEFTYELEKNFNNIDNDDDYDRDSIEARLCAYQDAMRKLGVTTVDELMDQYQSIKTQIDELENFEFCLIQLTEKLKKAIDQLKTAAHKLTSLRIQTAKIMESRVLNELTDLSMPDAQFKIIFEPVKQVRFLSLVDQITTPSLKEIIGTCADELSHYNRQGCERAQFYLSANAGEHIQPLHKVASGGEISRIMLALKRALASGAQSCVLVFDEIDTGISGQVADKVGQKLKELGALFQVICISHLPQVACYAQQHFVVEKISQNERTFTQIRALETPQEIEHEIARLISGEEITRQGLNHAKALLKKAWQLKINQDTPLSGS